MLIRNIIPGFVILFVMLLPFKAESADTYLSGFLQALYGGGTGGDNPTSSDLTASETRLQLRMESFSDAAEFFGRADLVYDDYYNSDIEIELREGFVKFKLGKAFDFKIGRQIITWGTGDLIFINDVFAKDYISFFNGRDDQYLKAPQNALRMEFYTGLGTFSTVYSPRFAPNRVPTGRRFSYFNPLVGRIVGGDGYIFAGIEPEARFKNGEVAFRYGRYFGSVDMALYAYHGFYKNPLAMNMADSSAYFPKLNIFGASLRFPALGGIAWIESGYYYSREDKDGGNSFAPNSKFSSLLGFERQLTPTLTANVQYQNEQMMVYDIYKAKLMPVMIAADEMYHQLTTRITKLLMMENLAISLFVFISPNEEDFYGRFNVSYKYSDALTMAIGTNLFDGDYEYSSFGSFKKNDNVFIKVTYGY